MKAIVAVDSNWGIGCNNELLQMIPEDMKFFKEKTLNKVVIMGRATFESLPGKKPLKDRVNIVLSKNEKFFNKDIIIARSIEEILDLTANYKSEDVFVIGGESVYRQFLPYCSQAYVTKINNVYLADKYFINLQEEKTWILSELSENKQYNNIEYRFAKYINKEL